MRGMFDDCQSFNQPLGHWDVSQVRAMDGMFHGATAFNQSLSEWDVSRVVTCRGMVGGSGVTVLPLQWDGNEMMSTSAMKAPYRHAIRL